MRWIIILVVLIVAVLSVSASAIGFGGYYTMSLPSVDYSSFGSENDFGGAGVKVWYDFTPNLSVVLSGGSNSYELSTNERYNDDYGNIRLWDVLLGGRFTTTFGRFSTYISGGGGFYRVIIEDKITRAEGTDWFGKDGKYIFEKPGVYIGGGLKTHVWGPLSAEVNPVFSYILGIDPEQDIGRYNSGLNKLYKFDINIGMAVDL